VITSREKAFIIAHAALDVQAEDVLVIDVRALSTITDYFVLCTAASSRQIEAISEHIDAALRRRGSRVVHVEGDGSASATEPGLERRWVLMDCSDVVVHVLDGPARSFYQIEHFWGDAPRVPVDACPPSAK
jgi:ribosome-associated protein